MYANARTPDRRNELDKKASNRADRIDKEHKERSTLDVLLMLDCTSSMTPWINEGKEKLVKCLERLKTRGLYSKVRAAFVAYRDFSEASQTNKARAHLFAVNFTEDLEKIAAAIAQQEAYGGGDGPEDVMGALEKALNLDWSLKIRVILHVTDAPSHGPSYHGPEMADNYPETAPESKGRELIMRMKKMDVRYYLGEVVPRYTKIMYDKFLEHAGGDRQWIGKFKLGDDVKKFATALHSSVFEATRSVALARSLAPNVDDIKEEDDELDPGAGPAVIAPSGPARPAREAVPRVAAAAPGPGPAVPERDPTAEVKAHPPPKHTAALTEIPLSQLECIEVYDPTQFGLKDVITYFQSEVLSRLRFNESPSYLMKNVTLRIDPIPFSNGSLRFAHYGFVDKSSQLSVVKFDMRKSGAGLSREHAESIVKRTLEVNEVCTLMAHIFNAKAREAGLTTEQCPVLSFMQVAMFIDPRDNSVYSSEQYLPGNFTKYNNNDGAVADPTEDPHCDVKICNAAQALSHFSYHISRDSCMIVDLQGVKTVLTDPAMHCIFHAQHPIPTDLMQTGIEHFFINHVCNDICKALKLPRHPAQEAE